MTLHEQKQEQVLRVQILAAWKRRRTQITPEFADVLRMLRALRLQEQA